MPTYSLVLKTELDPASTEGPGWYLCAFGDGASLIPPQRIVQPAALRLAQAFETALAREPDASYPTPTDIVTSGGHLVRQSIQEQLEFAEAQAQRVAALRRLLSYETSQTDEE